MQVAQNHQVDRKPAVIIRFAGPAILLLILVLFYWKLLLTNQYTWMESPDIAYQVLPWYQFQAGEWHAGRFPLWDPNSGAGQPLLGQMQPGAAYPLNWLLFLIPLKHGWMREAALNWYFVLIHYIAALACYALCRDLGRSRIAAILAGCVFALGGYVAHTDWPQMLNGAIWAPLVLLYLLRVERGEKPLAGAILAGFFLGVAWLSGHHQAPTFLSLAAAGTWLWLCVCNWRVIRLAALSFLVALLTSGLQTIPAAEYGRLAVRWTGLDRPQSFNEAVPYGLHTAYSLRPLGLLGIVVPNIPSNWDAFIGIVAFALALLGAILAWRERAVRYLAMVALGGILVALGSNSLLHGVLYALVPLVDKARTPAAAIVVFAAGVAPLAAFGLDQLTLSASHFWSRRFTWVLAGLSAILTLATLLFYAANVKVTISEDRMMITALGAALFAGLLSAMRGSHISTRGAAVAVLCLILFELTNETNYFLPEARDLNQSRYLHLQAEHSDLVQYVRDREDPVRVEYDDKVIPYNLGDWYGQETFDSYTASMPQKLNQNLIYDRHVRDFFGIRYFFGKAAQYPGQREVFRGASGLAVFENPNAFPRAWTVHQTQLVDVAQGRMLLANAGLEARRRVFLVGKTSPQLETCDSAAEHVDVIRHEPNRVVLEATMQCRGMAILTDTWFPGWTATVDGKSVPVVEAYGIVRGVVVEAGRHTVEMRYRPRSVFIGAGMSILAVMLVVFFARPRYMLSRSS
jgi:hypothetical protein